MGNMSNYIKDLDNLKHMLGMNYSKKNWGFRNYCIVYVSSEDEKSMNRLLKKGFVCKYNPNSESIGYYATEKDCSIVGLNKRQTRRSLGFWK